MHGPPNIHMGRAQVLFAVFMLGLGLWVHLSAGSWLDAGIWYALGVFFLCYGALMADWMPKLRRIFLIVGLLAGIFAFGFALRLAGIMP